MTNSILGDGWRGGSARAAVRGYVTRQGKRVKAHVRTVAKRQVKRTTKAAGQALVGRDAYRLLSNNSLWYEKIAGLLLIAFGANKPAKRKGGRR